MITNKETRDHKDKYIGDVLSKETPSKIPEGGAMPSSDLPRCT